MKGVNEIIITRGLQDRIRWLILLRWIAVVVVVCIIVIVKHFTTLLLPYGRLYFGAAMLALLNCINYYYLKSFGCTKNSASYLRLQRFANVQIVVDFFILSYLIHFSGGIENPFVYFYIFHVVIASILLSNLASFVQATCAILLLGGVLFSEQAGVLPHYSLTGFTPFSFSAVNFNYLVIILLVFSVTMYLAVFFSTSIVNRLRIHELELESLTANLKRQDQLKSQYVLTVSHMLDTSLSTIQNCHQVVLNNLAGRITDKTREMISRAQVRAIHLVQFVRELLILSRIRASEIIKKKSTSLHDIFISVTEQQKYYAHKKGIELDCTGLQNAKVQANPEALGEALISLLDNALRYTPQGGKVIARCRINEEDNICRVSVSDTGIGISQMDLPHVFEDFYRARNAQVLEKDGTGLGLAIVREIIVRHGGDVWIDSEVGKGTTVYFTLLIN